jgi:periplasmic protein CpxP/Spy
MRKTTLLYTVVLMAIWAAHGTVYAQSAVSSTPTESMGVGAPAKAKRTMSPDAIKRAKLTNLKRDVGLTGEEEAKVKPIIDRFVDSVQAAKHDPSLDSRTKRQQLAALRARYNDELDGVLTTDQQQKLASIKAQRLARLRAGRAGSVAGVSESPEPAASPASVQ